MKMVITSSGPDLDSAVDPRFGRAAYFLIIDSESGELLESINNSSGVNASHGAGISVAAMLADKGVQLILTGRVGPKAMAVVEKAKIKVLPDASGRVRDLIGQYCSENLQGFESKTKQGKDRNTTRDGSRLGQIRGGQCGSGKGGRGRGLCRQQ